MGKNLLRKTETSIRLIGWMKGRIKSFLHSAFSVKILFAVLLLSILWSAWSLRNLATEYSIRQFYPTNHPLLQKDREIRQTFGLNEKSPFLFVVTLPAEQNWLRPSEIRKLQKVSKSLQEREDVQQILSLPLIEGAQQTRDELLVGSLFERLPVSQWRQAVRANPLLYPLLVTSDFQSTLVIVEAKDLPGQDLQRFHRQIESQLRKEFPRAQIHSAGVPLIQTRLSKMIQSELSKFLAIAVVAFCAVFYFLFSHWTAIACAFLVLLASNLFSLGLLAALRIPLNVVLVTLPIITSVTVMSLLIHTLHLWSQKDFSKIRNFQDKWKLAIGTMRELALANFLGAWTTALGFLALAPSHIPMIRQYGWVVAGIVGVISVYSQVLIAVSLPFVQPRMRKWFDKPATWALLPVRHFKIVTVSLLGLSVAGAFLSSRMNFSGKLFDDLPRGDGVRASTEWIDSSFGGLVPYEVVLKSPSDGFWKDPLQIQRVQKLSEHLRKHPGVGSVVSLADFFQTGIPKEKASVAETFFLFSMAEKNPLSGIVTDNAQMLRLMIRLKDRSADQVQETQKWIQQSLQAVFPQVRVTEGGMATYAHSINRDVSHELVFGFWQSLVGIGIFLIFMFRSLRWALVSCLPNLIPPALLMGALALSSVPVKPGVALIFSIALGFAFNNTIYLLSRMRQLMKDERDSQRALRQALLMEANPCFFESFVMLVGFSIFLFSSFSANQTFGIFMMISIVAGFLGDLYFLPALLRFFPGLVSVKDKDDRQRKFPGPPNQINAQGEEKMDFQKIAVSAVLFVLCLAGPRAFAQTPQEILKKSRQQMDAKDDQAKVEMKIFEKNGEVKTRVIDLKTFRGHGFSVLAKIESPADIKGMGFLGHVKNGEESQWIYLPSSGQVRRVVTGKTKGGLLGSEISPEDLNSQAIKSATVKLLSKDAEGWSIEITPAKGSSAYSKAVTKISKKDFLPVKTEYYAGKRLKKTVEFKNYVKVGPAWRAQLIDVRNHFNGRGTQIRLSQMKINAGLKARDFSQSALKED